MNSQIGDRESRDYSFQYFLGQWRTGPIPFEFYFHALTSFTDDLIAYLIRSFQGTVHPEYFLIWLKNSNKLVKILKGDSARNCVMIDGKKVSL